jgi:integrase
VQKVKGFGLIMKEPKTRRSVRSISLPDEAVQLLRRVRVRQNEMRLALGRDYDAQGLVAMDPFPRTAPHPRHIDAVRPKVVSEGLGHATIGITLDTYSHVLPHMQLEAAQKLNTLLKVMAAPLVEGV